MIEDQRPIYCNKTYLPCRWSNQKRDGHIYEFPSGLEEIYKRLRAKKCKWFKYCLIIKLNFKILFIINNSLILTIQSFSKVIYLNNSSIQ